MLFEGLGVQLCPDALLGKIMSKSLLMFVCVTAGVCDKLFCLFRWVSMQQIVHCFVGSIICIRFGVHSVRVLITDVLHFSPWNHREK